MLPRSASGAWGSMLGLLAFVVLAIAGCLPRDYPTACTDEPALCDLSATDSAGRDTTSLFDSPGTDAGDIGSDVDAASPLEIAERACARLTACSTGVGAMDVARCMQAHLLATSADMSGHPLRAPAWSCIDAANSCGDLDKCFAGATATTACAAAGSGTSRICVGEQVTTCSSGVNVGAKLCALQGQGCVQLTPTSAECTGAGSCTSTTAPICRGNALEDCNGTVDRGTACDALGGTCSPGGGTPGCTGDDATCSGSATTCAGTRATSCRFGRVAIFECAALLSVCASSSGDSGTGDAGDPAQYGCAPSATECTTGDAPSCFGGDLRYCLGGHLRTIECTALGLGPCAATASLSGPSAACGRL